MRTFRFTGNVSAEVALFAAITVLVGAWPPAAIAGDAAGKPGEPKPLTTLQTPSGVARGLTFSPDGKMLAAIESVPTDPLAKPRPAEAKPGGAADGKADDFIIEPITGDEEKTPPGEFADTEAGQVRLPSLAVFDRLTVWNLKGNAKPRTFPAMTAAEMHPKPIAPKALLDDFHFYAPGYTLTFLDNKTLVGPLQEGQIRVWDAANGRVRATLQGLAGKSRTSSYITSLVVSPDRKLVAACDAFRQKLIVIDAATGKATPIEPPTRQVVSVAFSADSRRIAIAGCDYIEFYDPQGNGIDHIETFSQDLRAIAYLPKANRLRTFAAENCGTLREWSAGQANSLSVVKKPNVYFPKDDKPPYVHKVLFSPDGALLLAVRAKYPFELFNAESGETLARFDDCRLGFADAVFSPDGKYIATTTGENGTVKVWDVAALTGAAAK